MDIRGTWRKACSPAFPSREQIIFRPSLYRARSAVRRISIPSRGGYLAGRRAGPVV